MTRNSREAVCDDDDCGRESELWLVQLLSSHLISVGSSSNQGRLGASLRVSATSSLAKSLKSITVFLRKEIINSAL